MNKLSLSYFVPALARSVLFGSALVTLASTAHALTTYYVDSVAGSDSAAGTSISTPWKTLTNVNSHVFVPNERVAFKRGSTFANQNLQINGSGSAATPNTVTSYDAAGHFGVAATGALPKFTGNPTYTTGSPLTDNLTLVLLDSSGYWTIEYLDVSGGLYAGVGVWLTGAAAPAVCSHVTLQYLNIHDTSLHTGTPSWHAAGIVVANDGNGSGSSSATHKFDYLTIDHCTISNTQDRGLYITSTQILINNPITADAYYNTNVKITNNTISTTRTDGMALGGCKDFLVDGNTIDQAGAFDNTDTTKPNFNGMFWGDCLGVAGCVVQHNTVTNTAKHPKTDTNGHFTDNNAFDLDLGNAGLHILQYNFSNHNAGGFCEVLKGSLPDAISGTTDRFIARLNISHHDDLNEDSSRPWYASLIRAIGRHQEFYRNTFYCGTGAVMVTRSIDTGEDLPLEDYKFVDNLFYNPAGFFSGKTHGLTYLGNSSSPFTYDHNAFDTVDTVATDANYLPNNTNPVVGDPILRNETNPVVATDLQVLTTTPVWNAGTNTGVPNPTPQNDYFVYPYDQGLTIGADVFEDTMRFRLENNLTDNSGHGYNGTYSSGSAPFIGGGQQHSGNACLNLSAAGYVSCGTPTFGSELGIDLWVNPNAQSGYRRLVDKCTVGAQDGFVLDLTPTNQVRFIVGFSIVTTTATVTNGSWAHIEATYAQNGTIAVYINGTLAGSGAAGTSAVPNNAALQLRLGADQNGTSLLSGRLDDVKVRKDSTWRQ